MNQKPKEKSPLIAVLIMCAAFVIFMGIENIILVILFPVVVASVVYAYEKVFVRKRLQELRENITKMVSSNPAVLTSLVEVPEERANKQEEAILKINKRYGKRMSRNLNAKEFEHDVAF